MTRQYSNSMRAVTLLLACVLALSACGRRGAMEAPASATVITTDEAGNEIKKTAPKPDRPFFLDGLI